MQGGNYDDAFKIANDVGIDRIGLFLSGNVLEPSPQKFDGTLLDIAAAYYRAQHVKIDLTLPVVNTNQTGIRCFKERSKSARVVTCSQRTNICKRYFKRS
jgi:hypothetical protein